MGGVGHRPVEAHLRIVIEIGQIVRIFCVTADGTHHTHTVHPADVVSIATIIAIVRTLHPSDEATHLRHTLYDARIVAIQEI